MNASLSMVAFIIQSNHCCSRGKLVDNYKLLYNKCTCTVFICNSFIVNLELKAQHLVFDPICLYGAPMMVIHSSFILLSFHIAAQPIFISYTCRIQILLNWDCDNVLADDNKPPEANTDPVHEGKLKANGPGSTADEGGNYLTLLHWHSEWFTCALFQLQWYMQRSINISSYCRFSTHRPFDSCQYLKIILVSSTRLHSWYCQQWCWDQLFVCHQRTMRLMEGRKVQKRQILVCKTTKETEYLHTNNKANPWYKLFNPDRLRMGLTDLMILVKCCHFLINFLWQQYNVQANQMPVKYSLEWITQMCNCSETWLVYW